MSSSMLCSAPVINDDSSDARNKTRLVTSSGRYARLPLRIELLGFGCQGFPVGNVGSRSSRIQERLAIWSRNCFHLRRVVLVAYVELGNRSR